MEPALDSELIKMIRCPVTQSELTAAPESLIAELNGQIESGLLFNPTGQSIESRIDGGLLNADETRLLPIRDGIVILVVDQAIELENRK